LRIQKAVITAAGENQRALPLQTLIDRDGQEKSVLGILIEQALAARVEEICVVVWPGDETRYAQAAGKRGGGVRFVPQAQPLGYANAILRVKNGQIAQFTEPQGVPSGSFRSLASDGVGNIWLDAVVAHVGGGFLFLAMHAVLGEIIKHHKALVLTSFAIGFGAVAALALSLRLFG